MSGESQHDPVASRGHLRRTVRYLAMVLLLGFAVHVLLPQVAELRQGLQALRSGRWVYLGLVVVASGLVFVASAAMVHASVGSPPTWARTIATQIAAGFASTVTPAGLGWISVTQSSLQRSGTEAAEARAATGLNLVLTVVAHVGLLIVLLPFLPVLQLPSIPAPARRVAVDVTVVAAIAIGVLAWVPRSRRRILASVVPVLREVPTVLRDPRRTVRMVGGAVAQNLAFTAALLWSLAAFGAAASPLGVLVVYMVAATVAAISPTPGGLGAMEAALVAGLTRLGIPGGEAVAAVLTFRLATYWLPLPLGAWMLRRARVRGWV